MSYPTQAEGLVNINCTQCVYVCNSIYPMWVKPALLVYEQFLGNWHLKVAPPTSIQPVLNSEFSPSTLVAIPRLKCQSALLFLLIFWKENCWRHTFPQGICAMWDANSLVKVWTWITVFTSYNDNHGASMRHKACLMWGLHEKCQPPELGGKC